MGFDIRKLLAGIGVLLYGMHNFEQALNFLGGKKLKYLLQKYTKNSRMAIRTGTRTTTVLQSSTLISLLILAFVGAGVMALPNAIGVIFGANIGSPMLPLLAAVVGFGEFNIGTIALPFIGVGALILMFIRKERRQRYAKLIIGFGLFFVGIGRMKESVEMIRDTFDISVYKNLPLIGFGLLGMVFSAMMSSSGALGIITLAAVDGGIVSFPASIAIMMGANIGTTRTAFLASLGGNKAKRQVAVSHVMFNVLSTVIGVLFFWQYIRVSNELLGLKDNPAMSNAVLAVIYNVSTVILFGFFIKPFTRLVVRLVPDKEHEEELLHIQRIPKQTDDARLIGPQVLALMEDSKDLITKTIEYTTFIYGLPLQKLQEKKFDAKLPKKELLERDKKHHIALYEHLKSMADIMLQAVLHIKPMAVGKDNTMQLHHLETVIYSCLKSIKATKNIHHELIDLRENIDPTLQRLYPHFIDLLISYYKDICLVTAQPVNGGNGSLIGRQHQDEIFRLLLQAFKAIKHIHKEFSHLFYEANKTGGVKEIHVTSLINIDHYIYETLEMLFIATTHLYLSDEKINALEQLVDVDEEIYESFTTDPND